MKSRITFADLGIARRAVTRRWVVQQAGATTQLGTVKWFAPWRRYAFEPVANCVFDGDCLREIASFVMLKTQERKVEPER